MSSWIARSTPLTYEEMLNNMNIIYPQLKAVGWSDDAIFSLGGNSGWESTVNPMRWEESGGGGYGLLQWTPSSKLINWCSSNGLNHEDGNSQIKRILYEQRNNIQWFNNPISDIEFITWNEFSQINDLEKGVKAFMYYYEHPASWALHLQERIDFAKRFKKDVNKTGGGGQICYGKPIKDTNIDKSSFMTGQLFGTHVGNGRPNNFHDGLDFGDIDHKGNEMLAICDGEITRVGFESWARAYCVLSNGVYNIMYQEFSYNVGNVKVKVGDKVKKGDVIAIRDADHLHLGVTKKDVMEAQSSAYLDDGTWIDPLNILGKCFSDGSVKPPEPKPDKNKNNELIYLGRS